MQVNEKAQEVFDTVQAGIAALAESLEVPAEFVYEAVWQRVIAEGVLNFVLFLVSVGFLFGYYRYIKWFVKDTYQQDRYEFAAFAGGVLSLIATGCAIGTFVDGFLLLTSTDYVVLKKIASFVK